MLMIGVVIPQLLFAGALVPVRGASAFIAKGFISAYWALEAMRFRVEDYYTAERVGVYALPERSQEWGVSVSILLVHVLSLSLLTYVLMVRKDGGKTLARLGRSLKLLGSDAKSRLTKA
jgi:hypothetical protein